MSPRRHRRVMRPCCRSSVRTMHARKKYHKNEDNRVGGAVRDGGRREALIVVAGPRRADPLRWRPYVAATSTVARRSLFLPSPLSRLRLLHDCSICTIPLIDSNGVAQDWGFTQPANYRHHERATTWLQLWHHLPPNDGQGCHTLRCAFARCISLISKGGEY